MYLILGHSIIMKAFRISLELVRVMITTIIAKVVDNCCSLKELRCSVYLEVAYESHRTQDYDLSAMFYLA